MAKKFKNLREQMSPARQERNAERAAVLLTTIELAELRGALGVTQEELAERLEISQSNVSRMEGRQDLLLSTLQQAVAALGGELHLSAVFPDGSVDLLTSKEAA